MNTRNPVTMTIESLQMVGCHALFCDQNATKVSSALRRAFPNVAPFVSLSTSREPLDQWMASASTVPPQIDRAADDLLSLPMTGGTTGRPKGVMLTHGNFSALSYGMELEYADRDRPPVLLAAAPMTHVGGRIALASRSIGYGSAPMALKRLKEALARFGPVMRGGYGQTECPLFITVLPQDEHYVDGDLAPDERLRSIGHASMISEVCLLDTEGEAVREGQVGEICVKGPHVSLGYYNDPEETKKVRHREWHRTGDLGVISKDGYVTLVDRAKDMIITGGFNVYSIQVEDALCAIEGVATAAVLGIPDDDWGEVVCAAVCLEDGASLTEESLIAACRKGRLGGVMTPKRIQFIDARPLTTVGKVDKKRLRPLFG